MTDPSPRQAAVRRSRTAFLWIGLIVPLLIIVLATAVVAAWLPELPDPVATHWGSDGVDGFAPRSVYIVLTLGVGVGVVALMGLLGAFAHRLPQSSAKPQVGPASPALRFIGGMNLGMALLLSVMALGATGVQRGLQDATDAPGIGGWAVLGFVSLAAGAVLGWFLQPKSPTAPAQEGAPVAGIVLAANERAAWFGTATMARGGVIVLIAALVLLAAMTVFWAARGSESWWILAGTTLLIAVLIGTMVVFRVRVNASGLRVKSVVGWPQNRIPLDRVSKVEVVHIDPMAEFGGWGWRIGVDGRRGVVLRAGEALQVTQTDGRVFVVTVDGASEAATVLETLRAQAPDDRRRE